MQIKKKLVACSPVSRQREYLVVKVDPLNVVSHNVAAFRKVTTTKQTEPVAETSWTDKRKDDQRTKHQSEDFCRLTISSEVVSSPIVAEISACDLYSGDSNQTLVRTPTIPRSFLVFFRQEHTGAVPQFRSLPLPSAVDSYHAELNHQQQLKLFLLSMVRTPLTSQFKQWRLLYSAIWSCIVW
jgi:hypothetical protein